MKLPRRQFLHLAAGAVALPAGSRFAWAQAYPTRPVRIIIGFAPGGIVEIVARLIPQDCKDACPRSVTDAARPRRRRDRINHRRLPFLLQRMKSGYGTCGTSHADRVRSAKRAKADIERTSPKRR
jgi:hypothetical protein